MIRTGSEKEQTMAAEWKEETPVGKRSVRGFCNNLVRLVNLGSF